MPPYERLYNFFSYAVLPVASPYRNAASSIYILRTVKLLQGDKGTAVLRPKKLLRLAADICAGPCSNAEGGIALDAVSLFIQGRSRRLT